MRRPTRLATALLLAVVVLALGRLVGPEVRARSPQDDPPALNPFGPTTPAAVGHRDDALPGTLYLDDGTALSGRLYLTRDARLQIYDNQTQRQREVPLAALRQIDAKVLKEWNEAEWRFKENANDEKLYTGRQYPAREYLHTLTLQNGRTITGPLSAIVYVQPADPSQKPQRFLLHKRDKGPIGTTLQDLRYVKRIVLREPPSDAPDGNVPAAPPETPATPSQNRP